MVDFKAFRKQYFTKGFSSPSAVVTSTLWCVRAVRAGKTCAESMVPRTGIKNYCLCQLSVACYTEDMRMCLCVFLKKNMLLKLCQNATETLNSLLSELLEKVRLWN